MIKDQIRGKIVFVTSTAALIGYAGNSQYVATKFALRGENWDSPETHTTDRSTRRNRGLMLFVKGMADCLRNELTYHRIDIHIYYPPNMDTPGFEMEVR
jgi:3-dehydrosphinganine reductase